MEVHRQEVVVNQVDHLEQEEVQERRLVEEVIPEDLQEQEEDLVEGREHRQVVEVIQEDHPEQVEVLGEDQEHLQVVEAILEGHPEEEVDQVEQKDRLEEEVIQEALPEQVDRLVVEANLEEHQLLLALVVVILRELVVDQEEVP